MWRFFCVLTSLACTGQANRVRQTRKRQVGNIFQEQRFSHLTSSHSLGWLKHSPSGREAGAFDPAGPVAKLFLDLSPAAAAFSSSMTGSRLARNRPALTYPRSAGSSAIGMDGAVGVDEEWQLGTCEDGTKFLWRSTDDPDDPDIKFVPDDYVHDSDNIVLDKEWNYNELDDGTKYVWRSNGDVEDPDVKFLEDDWQVGAFPDGDKYLWRETDNPDEPEIKLVSFPDDQDGLKTQFYNIRQDRNLQQETQAKLFPN